MSNLAKKNSITSFSKNKENPFLKEAIEKIEGHVTKKYKNSAGYGEKAVLQAVDPQTGETLGHTTFIRQIEVDEEKFTKFYLSQFSAFWDLKPSAIRVFGYIMGQLQPKKDIFLFDLDDCMGFTGYKTHTSIHQGLTSLLESKIIARGKNNYLYFINPMIIFNGDRVTFARTYVKKKNAIKVTVDPNQTAIDFGNEEKAEE